MKRYAWPVIGSAFLALFLSHTRAETAPEITLSLKAKSSFLELVMTNTTDHAVRFMPMKNIPAFVADALVVRDISGKNLKGYTLGIPCDFLSEKAFLDLLVTLGPGESKKELIYWHWERFRGRPNAEGLLRGRGFGVALGGWLLGDSDAVKVRFESRKLYDFEKTRFEEAGISGVYDEALASNDVILSFPGPKPSSLLLRRELASKAFLRPAP